MSAGLSLQHFHQTPDGDATVVWTHVATDMAIGISYIAISAALVYLVWRGRREFPFQTMFLAFGTFIVACGATHLIEVYTVWAPAPWFSASVNIVTAAASVGTALLLPPLVPRILSTVRDARMTQASQLEAERARAELTSVERFRASVEEAGVGVGHLDRDGTWQWVNKRLLDITGYPSIAFGDLTLADVLHPADTPAIESALAQISDLDRDRFAGEFRFLHKDGEVVWVDLTISAVRREDGEIRYFVIVAQDVTVRREAADALLAAKDAADEANQAKSEFLSTMSHELRTPLNAIGGYVDLLDAGVHGPLSPAQAEGIERIRVNQRHLLTLINDVLNFARIETGNLEMSMQPVDVGGVLDDLIKMSETQATQADLRIHAVPPRRPLRVHADPDRLRQILLNLVSNAIKFTPSGGSIELFASEAAGTVRIAVADTGRGIPKAMMEKIFDPFVQVRSGDEDRDPSRQGVGLGLAISRDIVRAMDGEIEVESEAGVGSTFTVVLPSVEPAEVPSAS